VLFAFFFVFSCKKPKEFISELLKLEISLKHEVDLDVSTILFGSDSVVTDFIPPVPYNYSLKDLDSSLASSPANIYNFTRANIRKVNIDSVRIYLPSNTQLNANNIEYIKIYATRNAELIEIVNQRDNFNLTPITGNIYGYVLDLPVNKEKDFVSYMLPPTETIAYNIEAKFKEKLKVTKNDKYKLDFVYKFYFQK